MTTAGTFGGFFKERRRQLGLSLREFCRQNALDPGNLSKIERGVLPPPESRGLLEKYAAALQIHAGSNEWLEFFDLAAAGKGRIPEGLLQDEKVIAALPILYRTLRRTKLTKKDLQELFDTIGKAWKNETQN